MARIKRQASAQEAEYLRQHGFPDAQEGAILEYDDGTPEQPEPSSSSLGAGTRALGASVIPTIAGGAAIGALAGSELPVVGNIIGAIIGGIAASKAAGMAQEAVMPESWKQQLAQDAAEHPTATTVGSLAAMPLGGFMPGPTTLRAGTGLAKLGGRLVGKQGVLEEAEKTALKASAMGAGLNTGISLAMAPIEGRPITAGSLLEAAAIGGVFSHPTPGIAPRLGFHADMGLAQTDKNAEAQLAQPGTKPTSSNRVAPNAEREYRSRAESQGQSLKLSERMQQLQQRQAVGQGFEVGFPENLATPEGTPVAGESFPYSGERKANVSLQRANVSTIPHETGGHYSWVELPKDVQEAYATAKAPELAELNAARLKAETEAAKKANRQVNPPRPVDAEELYALEFGYEAADRATNTRRGILENFKRDWQSDVPNPTPAQLIHQQNLRYLAGKLPLAGKPKVIAPDAVALAPTTTDETHATPPPTEETVLATPPADAPIPASAPATPPVVASSPDVQTLWSGVEPSLIPVRDLPPVVGPAVSDISGMRQSQLEALLNQRETAPFERPPAVSRGEIKRSIEGKITAKSPGDLDPSNPREKRALLDMLDALQGQTGPRVALRRKAIEDALLGRRMMEATQGDAPLAENPADIQKAIDYFTKKNKSEVKVSILNSALGAKVVNDLRNRGVLDPLIGGKIRLNAKYVTPEPEAVAPIAQPEMPKRDVTKEVVKYSRDDLERVHEFFYAKDTKYTSEADLREWLHTYGDTENVISVMRQMEDDGTIRIHRVPGKPAMVKFNAEGRSKPTARMQFMREQVQAEQNKRSVVPERKETYMTEDFKARAIQAGLPTQLAKLPVEEIIKHYGFESPKTFYKAVSDYVNTGKALPELAHVKRELPKTAADIISPVLESPEVETTPKNKGPEIDRFAPKPLSSFNVEGLWYKNNPSSGKLSEQTKVQIARAVETQINALHLRELLKNVNRKGLYEAAEAYLMEDGVLTTSPDVAGIEKYGGFKLGEPDFYRSVRRNKRFIDYLTETARMEKGTHTIMPEEVMTGEGKKTIYHTKPTTQVETEALSDKQLNRLYESEGEIKSSETSRELEEPGVEMAGKEDSLRVDQPEEPFLERGLPAEEEAFTDVAPTERGFETAREEATKATEADEAEFQQRMDAYEAKKAEAQKEGKFEDLGKQIKREGGERAKKIYFADKADKSSALLKIENTIAEKERDLQTLAKYGKDGAYRFLLKEVNENEPRSAEDYQRYGFRASENPFNRHYWEIVNDLRDPESTYADITYKLQRRIMQDIKRLKRLLPEVGIEPSETINIPETLIKMGRYKQIDPNSPQFKKEFGESKVTDSFGKPLEVFPAGDDAGGKISLSPFTKQGFTTKGEAGNGFYVVIENPARHSDVMRVLREIDPEGTLSANKAKVIKALKKEGFDGIYDKKVHPEIIPFEKDAAIKSKRAYYMEATDEGVSLAKKFEDEFINKRIHQGRISHSPKIAGKYLGTYNSGLQKGGTSAPADTTTATHEALHSFFDMNHEYRKSIWNNAHNLTKQDVDWIGKTLTSLGYNGEALRLKRSIDTTGNPTENIARIDNVSAGNRLGSALEELFAQHANGEFKEHPAVFEYVTDLMYKTLGPEFTESFNTNMFTAPLGKPMPDGPAQAKWDANRKNLDDPQSEGGYYMEALEDMAPLAERGIKGIEGVFDKVNKLDKRLGPAFNSFRVKNDMLVGIGRDYSQQLQKIDPEVRNNAMDTMLQAYKDGVDALTLTDNPAERRAIEIMRKYYHDEIGQRREDLGILIDGRAPSRNPNYVPQMMHPDVANLLRTDPSGPEASLLREQWANHIYETAQRTNEPVTPQEATKIVDKYIDAMGSESSHYLSAEFGAIRKAEGYGMPDSIRDPDALRTMTRYSVRAAKDLAMFEHLEKPTEIREMLGLRNPYSGSKERITGEPDFHNNPEVQDAMNMVTGRHNAAEQARKSPFFTAATRLANAMLLGPVSTIRDLATIPVNMSPYIERISDLAAIGRGFAKMRENSRRALRSGAVQPMIDKAIFGDLQDTTSKLLHAMNKAADWARIGQGRELGENLGREALFSVGRELGRSNLLAARAGEAKAKAWIKKFNAGQSEDIMTVSGDKFNDALDVLAKNFVDRVQGSYSASELPMWVFDSHAAPFIALRKWGIEKANVIKKDVFDPAANGNFKPLIMYSLGTILTGAALQQIAELISNRKMQEPNIPEVLAQGRPQDYAAKLVSLMQVGSAAGIIGDGVKMATNLGVYGKLPQDQLSMPLIQAITDISQRTAWALDAAKNGDDKINIGLNFVNDVLKNALQAYRVVASNIEREDSARKDNFRDVRVYKQLKGEPVGKFSPANPYIDMDIKKWKKEKDPVKAAGMIKEIIQRRLEEGKDPDELRKMIRGLKANNYQTMPNPKTDPIGFREYYDYLVKTQGEDAARERLFDYYQQNLVNRVKAKSI